MEEVHTANERRKKDKLEEAGITSMFQVIREMASEFSGLNAKISVISERFEGHMIIEESQRGEVLRRITELSDKIDEAIELKQAFPHVEGKPDVRGHRTDHETRMEYAESSGKLWNKVKEEVVTKAVGATMIAMVVILGLGVKDWATSFIKSAVTTTTTTTSSISTTEKKHE